MAQKSIEVMGDESITKAAAFLTGTRNQTPFACSQALNDVAADVQGAEVEQVQNRFKVRTQWFRPGSAVGVNRSFANKGNLVSSVFTRAGFMVAQEFGGTKIPKAKALAIANKANLWMSDMDPFKQRDPRLPAGLLKNQAKSVRVNGKKQIPGFGGGPGGIFSGMAGRGHATPGIWQRRAGHHLTLLYQYFKSAVIKPRFGFYDKGADVVAKKYLEHFHRRLAAAYASLKH